jgi:hypothetical protein
VSNRIAVVLCVHHKPWLVQSTLISLLLQDVQDVDIHVIFQLGGGETVDRPAYREYRRLARQHGVDPQLSPWDERVREVCRLTGRRVVVHEFENDTALDSGAWYKFIRTGAWRDYDYVLFAGEGTLLTRPNTLSAMLELCASRGAHCVMSGHEKRRLSKSLMLGYNTRHRTDEMAEFHDRMIARVFGIFRRDPAFDAQYQRWADGQGAETQNHVSDVFSTDRLNRIRLAASPKDRSDRAMGVQGWVRRTTRRAVQWLDGRASRQALRAGAAVRPLPEIPIVHVQGVPRPAREVVEAVTIDDVRFHQVDEPEWYGCTVIQLFSRELLQAFDGRLRAFDMYEVLDVPYAATALELVWGFVPPWLGYAKWFTDGIHRVRKNFVTGRREDDAATMASYINRYFRGQIVASHRGDYLAVDRLAARHSGLRTVLPDVYFA